MNQFQFDCHTTQQRIPFILTSVISGTVAAFLIILAVKYTGLGMMLVRPTVMPQAAQTSISQPVSINDYEKTIIGVVDRIGPSVVMITTNTLVEDFDFFSGPEVTNIEGMGSGVVFRSDGYILTNNHVINGLPGMADKIAVVLSSGKSYPAKVIGVDPQTDLAVLKINNSNLPAPQWADSDQIQVGQTAIAIGNPLEETLKNTVTVGVVSARGRNIKINNDIQLRNLIQTDASINPGNSGGPLLDLNGKIIGINTLIAAKSQGIGFSIPSNTVKAVAEQLIEKGHVSRPGLGITYIHFNSQNVHFFELRIGRKLPTTSGLFIARVIRGSEADKAGLKPEDIIVAINGKRVGNEDIFREIMTSNPLGTKLKLDVIRNGQLKHTTAKIGEMKQ